MTDRVILREFLRWLLERNPRLSQIEVARRAGLSQSVIQKYVKGTTLKRYGDPETYRKVVECYPTEWAGYLETHPDALLQLQQDFAWVLEAQPVSVTGKRLTPELARGLQQLEAIFEHADGSQRQLVLQQLAVQLEFVRRTVLPAPNTDDQIVQAGVRRPVQQRPLPSSHGRTRAKA